MVYVLSDTKKPLMPCSNVIARLLLKEGKAKVNKREPFTIQLKYDSKKFLQKLNLGVDTGSGTFATAVSNEKEEIIYMSEVIVRNDITSKMDDRRMYRRNRRNRKCRYRKARFLNRRNSKKKDRFSPTMKSKLESHIKEIEYIKSILPIHNLILETGKFDTHLMQNPSLANPKVKSWGYQKGRNYGFENVKAKVRHDDNYACQYCKGKSKDSKLEVHHIIYRSHGGSDEIDNLITLCHTCHKKLHAGKITLKKQGKRKGALRYATQMNSIRLQLLKHYPNAIETFGFITNLNRVTLNLPKEHYIDSCVIATQGNMFDIKCSLFKKRCVPKGNFQQTKGIRSEKKLNTGKIHGFKRFDKVKYMGNVYFIKGRMSTGYATLMNIDGTSVSFKDAPKGCKTPKLKKMKRLEARKTWMVIREEVIQSMI